MQTYKAKKGTRFVEKPSAGESRKKAQNQSNISSPMTNMAPNENEEKLIKEARNYYAENQSRDIYPSPKEVAGHLRRTFKGFGLHPARIHQLVKSLSKS